MMAETLHHDDDRNRPTMTSNTGYNLTGVPATPLQSVPTLCPLVRDRGAPAPAAITSSPTGGGREPKSPGHLPPHASMPASRLRLSRRDLTNLTSQLAIMLRSGVDIASSLQSLARQSKRPDQTHLLQAVHADVLAGRPLSAALRPYTNVFGPSYVATVAAGEASGRMADILGQLANLQRSELRLRNSIRMLLAYPLLLMSVSGLVTLALVLFVLPRFAEIFDQFDMPLPAVTRWLLAVATELRGHWWAWGPLFLLSVVGGIVFRLSGPGRRLWDTVLLRMYVLRDVSRALLMGRVCRLLGLMVSSGVPLLDSLRIARTSVRNSLYQQVLSELEQDVLNGRGLADGLSRSDVIPASAVEMLSTAERTGNLGSVTLMIGEHFEEEGETLLRDMVTIVEPLITIGMGLVVAIVVASVMLPMFDMASFAKG